MKPLILLPCRESGATLCADESMRVHAEFGADLWCLVFEAGFTEYRLVAYCYPAGIALVAMA
jgi:hypothetical protein